VIARLFGGNVIDAGPNYPLDFDAVGRFDRDRLADELTKEFGMLIEIEELPWTFALFDKFLTQAVTEIDKRKLSRKYIYMA
jgi:hypothetical protein